MRAGLRKNQLHGPRHGRDEPCVGQHAGTALRQHALWGEGWQGQLPGKAEHSSQWIKLVTESALRPIQSTIHDFRLLLCVCVCYTENPLPSGLLLILACHHTILVFFLCTLDTGHMTHEEEKNIYIYFILLFWSVSVHFGMDATMLLKAFEN